MTAAEDPDDIKRRELALAQQLCTQLALIIEHSAPGRPFVVALAVGRRLHAQSDHVVSLACEVLTNATAELVGEAVRYWAEMMRAGEPEPFTPPPPLTRQ